VVSANRSENERKCGKTREKPHQLAVKENVNGQANEKGRWWVKEVLRSALKQA